MSSDNGFEVLEGLADSNLTGRQFRQLCMDSLARIPGYDWCGIYRLETTAEEPETLVLDAFVGAPTDHDRISVGQGVCGTAVATGENQVVDDVWALDNYLACSLETKSEAVVLIRQSIETPGGENALGPILGQIDIDSHVAKRFAHSDILMLEGLASLIAERW